METKKDSTNDKWSLLKRHRIPRTGDVYLDRFTIVGTPLFSIKFHRIYRPDRQRDLHDHPWNFHSFIVKGYYLEILEGNSTPQERKWYSYHKAEDFHRIERVSRSPIWTLVFCGKRRRDWGFKISETGEWVKAEEYEKLHNA